MSKPKSERRLPDNEAQAVGRMLRISDRKLNLVAQSIRGLPASKALAELTFSPKRIAQNVKKILQSAVANAENNHNLDVDDLIVSEAYVGKNIMMKRFHARGRGKGARILKPFSEITIIVRQPQEETA
jgi:large subunit ribosomal protein L22